MASQLARALAIEALWQMYVWGWSRQIVWTMDRNGTRARWFDQFRDEIEAILAALASCAW